MNQTITMPELNPGEIYAGILLGKDGEPDQHLILLPGQAKEATFKQAQQFAADVGGDLPTRREQSLLFANLPEQFEKDWYWSDTQHAGDSYYAWYQTFDDGYQNIIIKSAELFARAVRRSVI